jgi:hypothetical protein
VRKRKEKRKKINGKAMKDFPFKKVCALDEAIKIR